MRGRKREEVEKKIHDRGKKEWAQESKLCQQESVDTTEER
jgi:hypothetical protein